ncbi:hypothetical protein BB934_37400 (plasmid) [Microvirga ossetica]|uniref:Uncharacterized protein n=1 Tax=Microvirga ossetica TaxID=1882682 RepID=A0A1B2EVI2_9HYPH|nr:hypothetical protein [Microvirga ossetica]ANY83954.1 hypothetical protein BB934_37400 [Microvirga ossetica]
MIVAKPSRRRLAELTSGVGAIVLGIGLGMLAADRIGRFGIPLLLVGAAAHTWGMFDKHRLGHQADAPNVWWELFVYWACWILLGRAGFGAPVHLSGSS